MISDQLVNIALTAFMVGLGCGWIYRITQLRR